MNRLLTLFAIVIVVAAMACKKSENYNETTTTASETTATATETSASTAVPLNDTDKDFVGAAARGGIAELDLAQDGFGHATNADVKAFAQKLIDDHSKANQELLQFAQTRNATVAGETEAKVKEAKERLLKLTGKSFDQAFVQQMIDDHKNTITKFEDESKNGSDAELKAWVDKTLPTLREHLKTAEDLQAKVGKK